MAHKMGVLKDEKPLFIVILKGSFIFASDLVKPSTMMSSYVLCSSNPMKEHKVVVKSKTSWDSSAN